MIQKQDMKTLSNICVHRIDMRFCAHIRAHMPQPKRHPRMESALKTRPNYLRAADLRELAIKYDWVTVHFRLMQNLSSDQLIPYRSGESVYRVEVHRHRITNPIVFAANQQSRWDIVRANNDHAYVALGHKWGCDACPRGLRTKQGSPTGYFLISMKSTFIVRLPNVWGKVMKRCWYGRYIYKL